MPTLDDRLILTKGRPSGFDYLRIILASSVIFFHSLDLMAGHNVAFTDFHYALQSVYELILPMFFALSGFLVAGSLERSSTLVSFLGLRVIRLIPALLVETVLSAIVIGLLFTTMSYRDYFSSPIFARYFLNIVGDIHFYLPGVFENHPIQLVNAQLWTVPWEMRCYGAIAFLSIVGFARHRYFLLSATILLNAAVFFYKVLLAHHYVYPSLPGIILVESFLCGICFYAFRRGIFWNGALASAALAVFLVLASNPFSAWGNYLLPLPGAYLTVFLGLANPRRSKLIASGDYSYGIYLYGYPVQQSVISVFGNPLMPWWLNFLISMTIIAPLAVGSWHLIEKHAARLRGTLFAVEKRYVRLRGETIGWMKPKKPEFTDAGLNTRADS